MEFALVTGARGALGLLFSCVPIRVDMHEQRAALLLVLLAAAQAQLGERDSLFRGFCCDWQCLHL